MSGAGVVHHLRLLGLRQSFLPPVLAYLVLLAVFYASDAGPPLAAGALTAALLVPVAAWVQRLVSTAESEPFAEITLVRCGGRLRLLLVRLATGLLVGAALSVVAVAWAAIANPHPYPPGTIAVLTAVHLAEAVAGAGLGSLVSRPLRVRVGTAALVVSGWSAASLAVPFLPPAGPLLVAFATSSGTTAARVAAVAAALASGVLAAALGLRAATARGR
ncbi:hypothetical protein NUM3379_14020 [Kineococcus sp. NUM-3379]